MTTTTEKNLYTIMEDRKSVRKYDPTFKMTQAQLEEIIKEATSAPSSSNLQPWRFIVIQDEETKKNFVQLVTIKNKLKRLQQLLPF